MNIDIEQLTVKQIREIAALAGGTKNEDHPYQIGGTYFFRTVTHHHTGRLVKVYPLELVIEDAAWIADDGRLSEALRTGNFSEVEMFPVGEPVIIGRTSLIDGVKIPKLPTETK